MDKSIILLVAFALLSLMSSNANALDCYECFAETEACKDKFSTDSASICKTATGNGLNGNPGLNLSCDIGEILKNSEVLDLE